jgi:hypothetical protein
VAVHRQEAGRAGTPWIHEQQVMVVHPDAGTTEVAYALVHRARQDRPAAGTIAVNPGGPGGAAIPQAEQFAASATYTCDHPLADG